MAQIMQFDHVGITVADLDTAIDFFVKLGLELEGRMAMEGEFLDTVCGIPNSRTEIAMLRTPGGGPGLELGTFLQPDVVPGSPEAMANEVGIRNVAFESMTSGRWWTTSPPTATASSGASASTRTPGS